MIAEWEVNSVDPDKKLVVVVVGCSVQTLRLFYGILHKIVDRKMLVRKLDAR